MSVRPATEVCEVLGLDPQRTRRAMGFCVVGASGAVIDLVVTLSLLEAVHYLLANALGFVLAVSWNFTGNWVFVFDRPDGRVSQQYLSYVGLHSVTFGLRAAVVVGLVETTPTPAAIATVIGIGVAAITNFLGTEQIFDGVGELWFDAVAALNQGAHLLYSSRLRALLQRTHLYSPIYGAYVRAMGLLYRSPWRTVRSGNATATISMVHPPCIVSVMHTLTKEREVIDSFVDELEADDIVWDVGANVGVYSCLAGDIAAGVIAFEPFWQTSSILDENMMANDINGVGLTIALGSKSGTVSLAVERAEAGTQTPVVQVDSEREVTQRTGDELVQSGFVPSPDVVKIDVEGAESEVIEGMGETLKTSRLVYCETHGDGSVGELLEEFGFDVDVVDEGTQTYLRGVSTDE